MQRGEHRCQKRPTATATALRSTPVKMFEILIAGLVLAVYMYANDYIQSGPTGKVRQAFMHQGVQRFVTFDALHTPDFTINLISVSRLDEKGFSVEFKKGKAVFKTPEGSPFMEGLLVDGMYCVDLIAPV
ncbi:hypothetical protein B0H14DRAFT_3481713 [Mycena olivaceomarginata]|nr:hypothetical protein B0H14DRAFT_3481713 [Mycena olivaceomarginata]